MQLYKHYIEREVRYSEKHLDVLKPWGSEWMFMDEMEITKYLLKVCLWEKVVSNQDVVFLLKGDIKLLRLV